MSETTQTNNYAPTPAELKLIEILTNPGFYGKSVTERCQAAGVSRNTYYDAMRKPEFVDFYNAVNIELVKGFMGDVIQATYRFAKENPKCHQDRKILLEMAGIYKETTRKEITGKDGEPVESNVTVTSRTSGLSKEERTAILVELRQADEDTMDNLDQFREEVTE